MPLYSWWEWNNSLILLPGLDGGLASLGASPEKASGSPVSVVMDSV